MRACKTSQVAMLATSHESERMHMKGECSKKRYCLYCLKLISKTTRKKKFIIMSWMRPNLWVFKGSEKRRIYLDHLHNTENCVHDTNVLKTGKTVCQTSTRLLTEKQI